MYIIETEGALRQAVSPNQLRNDRDRARGRSFPFAENLITDSDDSDDYESKLKQLSICNHSNPPFPGEKAPPVMGDHPPASCAAYPSDRPGWAAFLLYTLASILVNFCGQNSGQFLVELQKLVRLYL